MSRNRFFHQVASAIVALAFAFGMAGCQIDSLHAAPNPQTEAAADNSLVIENPSELPDAYPHARYELRFLAHGGAPPYHWRQENGALPPGLRLEDDGLLHGAPERSGEFQFTVSVTDGGKPQQAVQKRYVIRVRSALSINWKSPAHVNGNRIEGTVDVSNTTVDDMDLTFEVKAVAENGRATEIGYQHFLLKSGTIQMTLPFGETLPRGAYMIYVDVNGEVAKWNAIYKESMRTPGPLQVAVGP